MTPPFRAPAARAPAARLPRAAVLLTALLWLEPGMAAAQPAPDPGQPAVRMSMLHEATILRIDVLTLTLDIRGPLAEDLRRLAARSGSAAADSIAEASVGAMDADASLVFERDVGLGRFLDEIRSSTRDARDAGFITTETYDFVDRSLPDWYAFLEDRGVREGDAMLYRIRGDTLGIRYRTADGQELLDQTDVGEERRRAVLGGYFAPGSDFREGLIDSLRRSVSDPVR